MKKLEHRIQNTEYREQENKESRIQNTGKRILYSILRIPYSNQGFTLIEALITVAIVGVIGFVLVEIMSQGFKTTNKTQVIGLIKQNGQTVLNLLDQDIRNADAIVCSYPVPPPPAEFPMPSPTPLNGAPTLVIKRSGQYIRYQIVPATKTANGYISRSKLLDVPASVIDQDSANVCGVTNKTATNPPTAYILDESIITDKNTATGVSVNSGSFTWDGNSKGVVGVSFNLVSGINSSTDSQIQSVPFKTTIQVR